MFTYTDDKGQEVIVLHYRCHCYTKRNHIFRKRVQKFCFCWKNVSWYLGLRLIAWMTISFGIIESLIFILIILPGAPSAFNVCLLFPIFCITLTSELIIFVALGLLLWTGVIIGNLKLIKAFPWTMLAGYALGFIYTLIIVIQGESIIKSLVWADQGITIKSNPDKEKQFFLRQQIIFYTVLTILVVAIILFTTYIIILSLSWIDKLEIEIENEN